MISKVVKRSYKGKSAFARSVMRVVNRQVETKMVMHPQAVCANQVIYHNCLTNLMSNVFEMRQGVYDDTLNNTGAVRIGSKIYLKGIKLAIALES